MIIMAGAITHVGFTVIRTRTHSPLLRLASAPSRICKPACASACVLACVRARACACACARVRACACARVRVRVRTCMCMSARVRACAHACVHACVRACVWLSVRACVRACACVRVPACACVRVPSCGWQYGPCRPGSTDRRGRRPRPRRRQNHIKKTMGSWKSCRCLSWSCSQDVATMGAICLAAVKTISKSMSSWKS